MNGVIKKVAYRLCRNQYSINGKKIERHRVSLEYWSKENNVGDALAPVILDWMLKKNNISRDQKVGKAVHLLTVGSILGMGRYPFDAVVWGSGIHCFSTMCRIIRYKNVRKLDIRAVRGPITRQILILNGYHCPEIYGDPAILMPLVYQPKSNREDNTIGIVRHFESADLAVDNKLKKIDTRTTDYEEFIDQICKCSKIISSSLHGIILAESYGVPAVFLQENMDNELIKFYDWYYSTNRKNIKIAYSIEEAIEMEPMSLPDLEKMRKNLLEQFPYDLWRD